VCDCQGGDGGGQQGTTVRRRRRRNAAEKVVDVGRRERALGQHGVASLVNERRDVVQLILVGAFLPAPALDVVLDVVETLHSRVDHPAHTTTHVDSQLTELRPKRPQTKTATSKSIHQNGEHVNKMAFP